MSSSLLLRVFVNERLTAAAEEIFHVFERTIVKYEEEASSSKQEIDRLRGLLLELMSAQKTDVSQSSACNGESPPQQDRSDHQEVIEPPNIKVEAPEHGINQQQAAAEEEPVEEFKNVDVLYQLHEYVGEQEETKPSLSNFEENGDSRETKTAHSASSVQSAPSSQTVVENKSVQDGRETQRPAASFTEQSRTSFFTSREPTESSHTNRDYQCYLCSKCFASSQHLINHALRMHSNDTGVLCAVCGKTLESTESLNFHLQSHKSSKCCYMCGKHCNSTTALTEHMASHAGVKLHRCHVCGKECSRKGDLKIHMRIHTGEKPFCCPFCCKSFTHSGHLKKHMRSHTGERPHRCHVCGRGFLQSTHLKYHLGTHAQKC